MRIIVTNVKNVLNKFNNCKKEYENLYYSYYNTIKDIDSLWNNDDEKQLMQNVENERKAMNFIYNDINSIGDIFMYIYKSYSFANKVMINLNEENNIINNVNNCINRLNKILRMFNYIDKSNMNSYQLNKINNAIWICRQNFNKLSDLKINITSNFNKIRKIENEVKNKITNLAIHNVKETEIINNIKDNSIVANKDIIILDSENLEKIAKLLRLKVDEEIDIISDISDCYIDFNKNYISTNNTLLNQISNDNCLSMNNNKNNHISNIYLINKRVDEVNEKINRAKRIDESSNIGEII